jgi:hypothetical protein
MGVVDRSRTQKPFSTRHRIIDVQGRTHEVIVIGKQLRNESGAVVGTRGFYIDVTPTGVPPMNESALF